MRSSWSRMSLQCVYISAEPLRAASTCARGLFSVFVVVVNAETQTHHANVPCDAHARRKEKEVGARCVSG